MRCRSAMGESMAKSISVRLACVSAAALLAGLGVVDQADAGGFAVREQSSYFQGSGFAGTAAGGDISSMFWNSAATATLPGFNAEASGTIIFPSSDLTATGGILAGRPLQNDQYRGRQLRSGYVRNLSDSMTGFSPVLRSILRLDLQRSLTTRSGPEPHSRLPPRFARWISIQRLPTRLRLN